MNIKEIKRRANSNGAWPQTIIFPEGTCTNQKSLITFKVGFISRVSPFNCKLKLGSLGTRHKYLNKKRDKIKTKKLYIVST